MTIAEFRVLVEQHFTIRCNNISERNAVLELLILLGYKVNDNSMGYLVPGNTDDRFLHPVMSSYESIICCRQGASDKDFDPGCIRRIEFAEVKDLLSYLDSNIDERTEDEFKQDFASLVC